MRNQLRQDLRLKLSSRDTTNESLLFMSIAIRISKSLCLSVVLLLLSAGSVCAADREFDSTAKPFFSKHCVQCHGPDREEGSVRVDQLTGSLDDLSSVDALQNILDVITVGSMPPASQPRPSNQALKDITRVLGKHLADARKKHSSGGGKPIRRLTRTEYVNTLYDLLGVRVDADDLPEDRNVGSFDTEALLLYTTDMHIQKTLAVAQGAARRFIASRNLKPGQKELKSVPQPYRKSKIKGLNKQVVLIKAADVPPAGFKVARLSCWKTGTRASEPVYAGPTEKIRFEITGTKREPQNIDRVFYESGDEEWFKTPGVEYGNTRYAVVTNPQPYRFFEPYRELYKNKIPDSAAKQMITDFVTLMNRGRKVDPILLQDLESSFRVGRKQGETFWEAMVQPMALAMCTIEVMFHFETRGGANRSRYVSPIEMVNRTSYFLWRSAPDTELIRLAQSKQWYDPKVRTDQLRRMTKDKKFERFLSDFAIQWLELDRQDEVAVNQQLFPNFDTSVKASMKEETVQFLSHVIRENLSLRNLIDSDFMLINNAMAKHYGFPRVHGDEFKVVPVPKNSRRGGILTHAGIMLQTGTGERTSIVERGVFVARKLLNDPPGPPPPLVDELPESGKAVEKMTAAELVAMHRKAPQCASCHDKIDPIGVGLEEFDAVGLFRTKDIRLRQGLTKRQKKNPKNRTFRLPLQTEGQVNSKRFKGVEGLKEILLARDVDLAEAYVQALLSMANGRKAGVADDAIVQDVIARAKKADLPALSILIALLRSDAFKTH